MRSLRELVAEPDAWSSIEGWIQNAQEVEVAPASPERGDEALLALQVTTRSVLGALAHRTAGVLIAGGWLRHLGSGDALVGDGLREWNASLGGAPLDPPLDGALIVAHDAIGGLFAINAGGLPGDAGVIHYFAPDSQAWMSLEMGHAAFVQWSLSPQLDLFYEDQRWTGWQTDVRQLAANEVMSFYPPLGFETMPLDERTRRPAPAREVWLFLNEIARQTAGLPEGTPIRLAFE